MVLRFVSTVLYILRGVVRIVVIYRCVFPCFLPKVPRTKNVIPHPQLGNTTSSVILYQS